VGEEANVEMGHIVAVLSPAALALHVTLHVFTDDGGSVGPMLRFANGI
jgi:hypothetical protein